MHSFFSLKLTALSQWKNLPFVERQNTDLQLGLKTSSIFTWGKIDGFSFQFTNIFHRKTEFRKGPKVYQRRLEEIEEKAYAREDKVEVIKSLKFTHHEYLSFFVCRNPIEKLLSVYKYMKDLK